MNPILKEYLELHKRYGYFNSNIIKLSYLLSKEYKQQNELNQTLQYITLSLFCSLCLKYNQNKLILKEQEQELELEQGEEKEEKKEENNEKEIKNMKINEKIDNNSEEYSDKIPMIDIFLLFNEAFDIPIIDSNYLIPTLSYINYGDIHGLLNYWNYSIIHKKDQIKLNNTENGNNTSHVNKDTKYDKDDNDNDEKYDKSICYSNALKSLIKIVEQKIISHLDTIQSTILQSRILLVYGQFVQYIGNLEQSLEIYQQSISKLKILLSTKSPTPIETEPSSESQLKSSSTSTSSSSFYEFTLSTAFEYVGKVLIILNRSNDAEKYLSQSLMIRKFLKTNYYYKSDNYLLPMFVLQSTINLGNYFYNLAHINFLQSQSFSPNNTKELQATLSPRTTSGWSNVEKWYELSITLCNQIIEDINSSSENSELLSSLQYRCQNLSNFLTGRLGITLQRQAIILIQDSFELLQACETPILNDSSNHNIKEEEEEVGVVVEDNKNGQNDQNEIYHEKMKSKYILQIVNYIQSTNGMKSLKKLSSSSTQLENIQEVIKNSSIESYPRKFSSSLYSSEKEEKQREEREKKEEEEREQISKEKKIYIQDLIEWGCYTEALHIVQSELDSRYIDDNNNDNSNSNDNDNNNDDNEGDNRNNNTIVSNDDNITPTTTSITTKVNLGENQFVQLHNDIETADYLKMESEMLYILNNFPLSSERYETTIKLYSSLHRIVPDTVISLVGLAKCYQSEGNYKASFKLFRKAISLLLKKNSQLPISSSLSSIPNWLPEFRNNEISHNESCILLCDILIDLTYLCFDQGFYRQANYLDQVIDRIYLYITTSGGNITEKKLIIKDYLHCQVLYYLQYFQEAKELIIQIISRYKSYYTILESSISSEIKHYRSKRNMKSHIDIAHCLTLQGMIEFSLCEFVNANQILSKSMSIYKSYYPTLYNLTVLNTVYYIAQCNHMMGFYSRAELEYQHIIKVSTHLVKSSIPLLAKAYCGLGRLKYQYGNYIESIKLMNKSLDIIEHRLGKYHSLYLETLLLTALCYQQSGNFDISKQLYDNFSTLRNTPISLSLTAISNQLNLPDLLTENENSQHVSISVSINEVKTENENEIGIGIKSKRTKLSQSQSQSPKSNINHSIDYGNIFLKIKEFHCFFSLLDEIISTLPIVTWSALDGLYFYHIANRHIMFGQYSHGIKLLETSLQIFHQVYPKKHYYISDIYYLQAKCYLLNGNDYKMAIKLIKKCNTIRKHYYGEDSIPVAESLYLMGMIQIDKGDYNLAEESLIKSYETILSCYGLYCSLIIYIKNGLGKLYTLLSRYDDALTCLNESFTIQKEINENIEIIKEFSTVGSKEDELIFKETIPTIDTHLYSTLDLGDTYTIYSELFITQHNWINAEKYCLISIEIYEKFYLEIYPNHPKLLNSKGNLGLIYLLNKKSDELVHKGEELIEYSLNKLLYYDDHNHHHHHHNHHHNSNTQSHNDNNDNKDKEVFHSYHHPWIKKLQFKYCLPVNNENSNELCLDENNIIKNDSKIESNLLLENYKIRSKNNELENLINGLKSQITLLEQKLQITEEMNETNQKIIQSYKKNQNKKKYNLLNESNNNNSNNNNNHDNENGNNDNEEKEDLSDDEFLPRIGTIAKSLGYAKKTFTLKKYQPIRR